MQGQCIGMFMVAVYGAFPFHWWHQCIIIQINFAESANFSKYVIYLWSLSFTLRSCSFSERHSDWQLFRLEFLVRISDGWVTGTWPVFTTQHGEHQLAKLMCWCVERKVLGSRSMASIHHYFARKQVGDTQKRGKPEMRSSCRKSLDLHWSASARPGRGSASVPHLRYLSVSRHFNE